jgi:hypothetical protein
LAAGQGGEDPEEAYKLDLFTGERPPGRDREMALAFVRSATHIRKMADVAFFEHYGETSRIVDCFEASADKVAEQIFDLYRRHAEHVCRVCEDAISAHAAALLEGTLSPDCLLTLIIGQNVDIAEYPALPAEPVEAIEERAHIRIALDERGKRVVFDRWDEMKGVNAQLLLILAVSFQEPVQKERTPEKFLFISAKELCRQIGCGQETLRKRVNRCRKQIAQIASEADSCPPPIDAVIENHPWYGYRLNPDRVRIIAMSDLSSEKRSRLSENRSHPVRGRVAKSKP